MDHNKGVREEMPLMATMEMAVASGLGHRDASRSTPAFFDPCTNPQSHYLEFQKRRSGKHTACVLCVATLQTSWVPAATVPVGLSTILFMDTSNHTVNHLKKKTEKKKHSGLVWGGQWHTSCLRRAADRCLIRMSVAALYIWSYDRSPNCNTV